MLRLFQPPTRDAWLSRHPLTGLALLLHLAVLFSLVVPIRRIVTKPLLDHDLVYLVPPDQKGGADRVEGQLPFVAAAITPGEMAEGLAPATQEAQKIVARGDTPEFSAQELGATLPPQREREVAMTELEVDSTVVRDPRSAAPSYPPALLARGITGFAQVRYVVDTLGAVDTLSYRVVLATHPDFAVAVRRVLAEMHFRPAVVGGRRVRQWVEQTFHFRIAPQDTTAARTAR